MAGEKRSQDQEETLLASAVLIDIEGTTTSISFVKEVLFPYVRQNLKDYIEAKWEDEEFKLDYEKLKEQAIKDKEDKLEGFVAITGTKPEEEKDSLLKNVLWQMDNDRKTAALKQLQGHMWREAYKTGAVKAHVYEDVPKALESWVSDGRKIYVYSSGSVEAQKLLFGNSVHGDLLKYFNDFFDTEIGAKQEVDSYKNILNKINEKPSSVIFLTDVVKEAAAAKEAGLTTVIVVREGNAVLTDEEKATFKTVQSFLDLTFQTSAKRQKLETIDKKVDESTADIGEPMDTSEDVEMSDVSEKKLEKEDAAKEAMESEPTVCVKSQSSEDASTSLTQKKEPIVAKEASSAEQEIPISGATEPDIKSEDANEKMNTSESTEEIAKDDVAMPTAKDSDKIAKSEKTKENVDTVAAEVTPAADDSMDTTVPESVSKSESASMSAEKKTEEITDNAIDAQSEITDKAQTTDKKADDSLESQTCDKNTTEKPEDYLKEKDEAKEESKVVSDTPESEQVLAKNEKEEETKMETTVADVTENGETTTEKTVDKTATIPQIVTESEATTSTIDAKREAPTEALSEKSSLEKVAESEGIDEKKVQDMETEEAVATDVKKCENEATKQETTSETVKEENVVDVKDKNTVDSEKQKLNGTTQNGNTDVPVLDDKLHSNGLNEGPSKETSNEDAAATATTTAQNGEAECSSESSAESIKVKKVVDSAVADGAGEPDVVPPVVVATS